MTKNFPIVGFVSARTGHKFVMHESVRRNEEKK